MNKSLVLVIALLTLWTPAFGRHTQKPQCASTHGTYRSSTRPYYGGGHHTASHNGHYQGETNSTTHKGGHYTNPRTGNSYGRHK